MRCIPKYFLIPTVAEETKTISDLLDTPNCVTGSISSDTRKRLLSYSNVRTDAYLECVTGIRNCEWRGCQLRDCGLRDCG